MKKEPARIARMRERKKSVFRVFAVVDAGDRICVRSEVHDRIELGEVVREAMKWPIVHSLTIQSTSPRGIRFLPYWKDYLIINGPRAT